MDMAAHSDSQPLTPKPLITKGLDRQVVHFKGLEKGMAEREGFEPPVPAKVRLISSQVHSTGLCHLSDSD